MRATPDMIERLQRDGVILLKGCLEPAALKAAEQAFTWSINNLGPHASTVLQGGTGAFIQDHANPNFFPAYEALLLQTTLCQTLAVLMECQHLWLLYEQIWMKESASQETPWHQDLPYIPISGRHLINAWIPLDPVEDKSALRFVPGSHLGPLYNPPAFDAADPSAAMFDASDWPPFPNFESFSREFEVVTIPTRPSDVLVFHPAILHGGGRTEAGQTRRSISLRFFGDDAKVAARPENEAQRRAREARLVASSDPIDRLFCATPGAPFRDPSFLAVV